MMARRLGGGTDVVIAVSFADRTVMMAGVSGGLVADDHGRLTLAAGCPLGLGSMAVVYGRLAHEAAKAWKSNWLWTQIGRNIRQAVHFRPVLGIEFLKDEGTGWLDDVVSCPNGVPSRRVGHEEARTAEFQNGGRWSYVPVSKMASMKHLWPTSSITVAQSCL